MNVAAGLTTSIRRPLRYVALGGVAAGTLDLIYICSLYAFKGVSPVLILQSIAAGWLGRDAAIAGGSATALLGLLSHFGIALVMAYVYYAVSRHWRILVEQPLRYGAMYGLLLYAVMTYVVVPLSAAGGPQAPAWQWINLAHIAAHVFLVGVPCALAARSALRGTRGHR
ncbi:MULTISPECIES: hypothetical protein [unclassified Pseudoxanthomonas]|jgi:hypothetical protein|uniref:hypothetical protein n=1 Tax=unclassified Pseudoxanthomonas TaxID=2645906 RepID=UPI003077A131